MSAAEELARPPVAPAPSPESIASTAYIVDDGGLRGPTFDAEWLWAERFDCGYDKANDAMHETYEWLARFNAYQLCALASLAEDVFRDALCIEARLLRDASRPAVADWWFQYPQVLDDPEFVLGEIRYSPAQLRRARGEFTDTTQQRLTPIHAHVHRLAARDGWFCAYCGKELACACDAIDLELDPAVSDHVIPRSRGGGNEDANRALACVSCNSSKRDMTPDEWGRPLWGWMP